MSQSVSRPNMTLEVKVQGCVKIMEFVCVVDGHVLPVVLHVNEARKAISVHSAHYLKVILETNFTILHKIY